MNDAIRQETIAYLEDQIEQQREAILNSITLLNILMTEQEHQERQRRLIQEMQSYIHEE